MLICDPWVEGLAFNNGWSLLDTTTSNDKLVDKISSVNKPLYIWYSHEHSDHFAVPFLKKLKLVKPDTVFCFQTTNDQRVVAYLRQNQFEVHVLRDGKKLMLSKNSWMSVMSWRAGDSLAIMHLDGFSILNLNDCIIYSVNDCEKIKNLITKLDIITIDLLFTQFGYANWFGNEADVEIRQKEAQEKLKRIATQIEIIKPNNVILFASFIFFCSENNFYLNDKQNSPLIVRASETLNKVQDKIFFMKPYDFVTLDDRLCESLKGLTLSAEKHWQELFSKVTTLQSNEKSYTLDDVCLEFKKYKKKIFRNFYWIFALIEMAGLIKSLNVKISDKNSIVKLSYKADFVEVKDQSDWDISMSSSDLIFSLKNDFGFDCTHVNGRFRAKTNSSSTKFLYFAGPQNMLKNGFGWKHPFSTIKEFFRLARR